MIRVKNLSVLLALALSITAIAMTARAQDKDAKPADKPADAAPALRHQKKNLPSPSTALRSAVRTFLTERPRQPYS